MAKKRATNASIRCPTLTVDQAAQRLGANPMDLWGLIHRGECPGLRRFGRYVIEESALDEVLVVLTRPEPKSG